MHDNSHSILACPANQEAGARVALAGLLGLRPLDRIQINSKRTISESKVGARMAGGKAWSNELPWWFFQRITEDGKLQVMAPGGYVTTVDPQECCDVRQADPVMVMAMPAAVFLARLRLPPAEARKPPSESDYAPAFVRYVTKDKWARVDCIAVEFEAAELNKGNTTFNQIRQEDRDALSKIARRDRMPVVESLRSTMASADRGEQRNADQAKHAIAAFFRHSLQGRPEMASLTDALRESGLLADQLSATTVNRMEMKLMTKQA